MMSSERGPAAASALAAASPADPSAA